jgi:hypothetical protein
MVGDVGADAGATAQGREESGRQSGENGKKMRQIQKILAHNSDSLKSEPQKFTKFRLGFLIVRKLLFLSDSKVSENRCLNVSKMYDHRLNCDYHSPTTPEAGKT